MVIIFPEADIRLESPQSLIRAMGGSDHAVVDGWNIEWHLSDGRIFDIPIDPATNLPLFKDFVCTSEEQNCFEAESMNTVCVPCIMSAPNPSDQYERKKALFCCNSVTDETNQNLSGSQKELPHWHQKLCVNMQEVQQLMRHQTCHQVFPPSLYLLQSLGGINTHLIWLARWLLPKLDLLMFLSVCEHCNG